MFTNGHSDSQEVQTKVFLVIWSLTSIRSPETDFMTLVSLKILVIVLIKVSYWRLRPWFYKILAGHTNRKQCSSSLSSTSHYECTFHSFTVIPIFLVAFCQNYQHQYFNSGSTLRGILEGLIPWPLILDDFNDVVSKTYRTQSKVDQLCSDSIYFVFKCHLFLLSKLYFKGVDFPHLLTWK